MSYILVDENKESIFLGENFNSEIRFLSALEVFNLMVRRKGEFTEFAIEEGLSRLKFSKKPIDLLYKISFESNEPQIEFFFKVNGFHNCTSNIYKILDTEYTFINDRWFPISKESLLEVKDILNKFPHFQIEVHNALGIVNGRDYKFQIKPDRNLVEVFEDQEPSLDSSDLKLFTKELYSYQKRGVSWLKFCVANKLGTILGDDMGLGKTAQIIALVSWILEKKIGRKILIVVPSTLLENWRREFSFFAPSILPHIHHGHMRVGVASGFNDCNVVITSYSLVINDFYLLDDVDWDLTILDEASLIKNPDSERTKKIKELNSNVRIAMTGTPVENSLLDLWSLVDFVYSGYFGDLESFKEMYISNNISETLEKDLSVLKEATSQIMLRRMKEDILEGLPDKIDIHQALVMSDFERIEYERIRNEILQMAEENKGLCFKLINDLRQFTTHPSLLEDTEIENIDLNSISKQSKKLQRTIEILDEIYEKGEKVLIFTGFIKMIDILKSYLKVKYSCNVYGIDGRVETMERQVQIDKFSSERGFSIMVLNPTTAAMGLNITAANHVIHYTRQWNPAIEIQASARAYRNGQKLGVNIYYLFYADTIEETMDNRLRQKEELSSEVISVVEHGTNEAIEILNSLKKNNIT